MARQHSRFLEQLVLGADLVVLAAAWLAAYVLRFYIGPIPVTKGIPRLGPYVLLLVVILPAWLIAAHGLDLQRLRSTRGLNGAGRMVIAVILVVAAVATVAFFYRRVEFSRVVMAYFALLAAAGAYLVRGGARRLLARGFLSQRTLIVGSGPLAAEVAERIGAHPELGARPVGLVLAGESEADTLPGPPVAPLLGRRDELRSLLGRHRIERVLIALPIDTRHELAGILEDVGDHPADIQVVTDLHRYVRLRGGVEELEGLAVVHLQGSPLHGWNRVVKRTVDLSLSAAGLLLLSPLFVVLAVAVRSTSPGPVLYRQRRMGLDGRTFTMYKFRTMFADAEARTGPVWPTAEDPRITRIGRVLRRSGLDELPQLVNVLKGEMSLVGPRPERPAFVEQFRHRVPGYMLRHKIKGGITGWAQVNGWVGDSSLERRLEHDLEYIERWSPWLDLKILWLTLWRRRRGRS